MVITWWIYLLQSSLLAAELPKVKIEKSARFLPQRLEATSNHLPAPESSRTLITQSRQGDRQEYSIPADPSSPPEVAVEQVEVIEVIADRQEYDRARGIITAQGNVVMRFGQSVMTSDSIELNLNDRLAVAQGQVVLTR
ncbi:MAG: LptA/OstA family protein, partial [Cyanobacteria bacterium J06631_6]